MKFSFQFNFIFIFCLLTSSTLFSQLSIDTRLLYQPAVSESHIAFIYAEDLWVAKMDGSNPVRLTIDQGIESNPVFSPDGPIKKKQ